MACVSWGGHRDFLMLWKQQRMPNFATLAPTIPPHSQPSFFAFHHFLQGPTHLTRRIFLQFIASRLLKHDTSLTMADFPFEGKPPAKRHPPSRLKFEVHAESTDDERVPEDRFIQAPDSQTVIPETQLDHHQDNGRGNDNESDIGDPLTPRSAAVIDKFAIQKKQDVSEPFAVKMFSKDLFSSQPEFKFSFSSQPRKATDVAPAKVVPKSSQPVNDSAPAVQHPSKAGGNSVNGECPQLCVRCALTVLEMTNPLPRLQLLHQPRTSPMRHSTIKRQTTLSLKRLLKLSQPSLTCSLPLRLPNLWSKLSGNAMLTNADSDR